MKSDAVEAHIKAVRKTLPRSPGVYRMLGHKGELLYVGKARNLKNRVNSYFTKQHDSARIAKMVSKIHDIELTITATEAEALLLESNLIKEHRPRYNITLRDDKSYPYIYVATDKAFPRLSFYRGSRKRPGRFFGPYPSATSVRYTLNQLQKAFQVRLCDDSYFANRSRPCLQHQIKRCTAPCVDLISKEDYARDVADSMRFLQGKGDAIIAEKVVSMERASAELEFESAAVFRDQIEFMRRITQQQYVSGAEGNADIIAIAQEGRRACVQVFYIRQGNSIGNRAFYPSLPDDEVSEEDTLTAFVSQYYLEREIPEAIICNRKLGDYAVLEEVLAMRRGGKVKIQSSVRAQRAHWLKMAEKNAQISLESQISSGVHQQDRVSALQAALSLPEPPTRMECFDISHTQGEATVASCVVFDEAGPKTSDYRRFNIEGITPGDDYAAMHQALMRRYKRIQDGEVPMPDILFIDGGKGQLKQAKDVLDELAVQGVMLVGVAKGEGRKPGLETLFVGSADNPVRLPEDDKALHLIQHIRDEAHRFAITGHRRKRAKARKESTLEAIPGLGPKRRRTLLTHFGGLRGVARASVEELAKLPGISTKLAEQIYAVYHAA